MWSRYGKELEDAMAERRAELEQRAKRERRRVRLERWLLWARNKKHIEIIEYLEYELEVC